MNKNPIIYPPGYFLGALILMVVLHLGAPGQQWLFFPWNLTALLPLLAGLQRMGSAARLFAERDTTLKPFAQSTTLVMDGAFGQSRNPMYLGMVLMLMAVAVLLGSLTPWLVIPSFVTVITRRFIVHEEHMLREQFGDAYDEYCQRVRRWI